MVGLHDGTQHPRLPYSRGWRGQGRALPGPRRTCQPLLRSSSVILSLARVQRQECPAAATCLMCACALCPWMICPLPPPTTPPNAVGPNDHSAARRGSVHRQAGRTHACRQQGVAGNSSGVFHTNGLTPSTETAHRWYCVGTAVRGEGKAERTDACSAVRVDLMLCRPVCCTPDASPPLFPSFNQLALHHMDVAEWDCRTRLLGPSPATRS